MDKDFLIKLTNNLYHLTLLFPKKEPLRYKMRELAAGILTKPRVEDLVSLNNFFELAKFQNWVSPSDILAIQKDYVNLSEGLKEPAVLQIAEKNASKENPDAKILEFQPISKMLIERQEKMLTVLKEKGSAQVWEMKQIFPEVSKRTLRRDFEFLLKQGVVKRIGERNNTFYQIN
ncbi:DeoR family transcriptional regulator [Patescibacteria group bacterium]